MARTGLPQLGDRLFLTDSGLETTLIFKDGYELPEFASFVLLDVESGRERLARYYRAHAAIAKSVGAGFIFESVGWRASSDWGSRIGYDADALARVNRDSIALMSEVRAEFDSPEMPTVLSGCVGPRGDAYRPAELMSADEAEAYHRVQISTYATTEADMVTALTLTYSAEASGIVRAASGVDLPVAISFTVETDGSLPSGESIRDAIGSVDDATGGAASYFMINCAHPAHFDAILEDEAAWTRRIRGVRANSSRKSHAELDESTELDAGDPEELAALYATLKKRFFDLTVLGGCCGTDETHIRMIAAGVAAPQG